MIENHKLSFDICKELLYKIVEEKMKISKTELLSKRRTRELADIRRIFVKILKINFPQSKVEALGKTVDRNHSNVSIQLKKHDELISFDNMYISLFHKINDEFFNSYSHYSINDLYELRDNLAEKMRATDLIINELENKK